MDPLQRWFFSIRERRLPGYPEEFVDLTGHGRPDVTIGDIVEEGLDPGFRLTWSEHWYGSPELRRRILEAYGHRDLELDHVLVSHGTNAANFVALQALLEPGDEVVLQVPSWMQAYMVTTHFLRCDVKLWPATHEGGWRLDLDRLQELVTPRTRLVWLVSPGNPTGMVVRGPELRAVADLAGRHGAWVLQDAGHRGLEWQGGMAPAIVDVYERGILTGGLAKGLGVTGLRIGWILSRDRPFVARCNVVQTYVTLCTSWPGEALATRLLEPARFHRILESGKAVGRRNREAFDAWLARHARRFAWVPPEGSYLAFPRYAHAMGSWELCERALQHRVVLAPGAGFLTEGHVRIGLGIPPERFAEGLRRLDGLVEKLEAGPRGDGVSGAGPRRRV
jgi:hypothetical protein